MKDEHLQMLQNFKTKNEWPANLSKQDRNYSQNLADWVYRSEFPITTILEQLSTYQ